MPIFGGPGRQSLVSVTAAETTDGLRFVAVGATEQEPEPSSIDWGGGATGDGSARPRSAFVTWWSADGRAWHPQGVLDLAEMGASQATALIPLGDRFLAVGHTTSCGRRDRRSRLVPPFPAPSRRWRRGVAPGPSRACRQRDGGSNRHVGGMSKAPPQPP